MIVRTRCIAVTGALLFGQVLVIMYISVTHAIVTAVATASTIIFTVAAIIITAFSPTKAYKFRWRGQKLLHASTE